MTAGATPPAALQIGWSASLGAISCLLTWTPSPPGRNFVDVLREEVAKCGVLIAVIGPDWLDARDKDGNRRLDNPNDFVRIEIATALQRKEYPRNPNLARRLKDSKGRSIARGSQRAFVTQQP
jgi:hypothetical protein